MDPLRWRSEGGWTLVEVLTASSIMLIALAIFTLSLQVALGLQRRNDQYSRSNDAVQLALQTMDRQVRSGYVAADTEPLGTDSALKIYTEAGGKPQCVAWALAGSATGDQSLYTTDWTPSGTPPPFDKNTWRLVTGGIVNFQNVSTLPLGDAFKLVSADSDLLKSVQIRFFLNSSSRKPQTIEFGSILTSRNTVRMGETVVDIGGTKQAACGA